MIYKTLGNTGLQISKLILGLWKNFPNKDFLYRQSLIETACDDFGINAFDLANNYGENPGDCEKAFGQTIKTLRSRFRDQVIISTKAGYPVFGGRFGSGGSRKHLFTEIDNSLKNTGLEYFDIFFHHKPDPQVPMEETVQALCDIVRSGKAIYVGLSKYDVGQSYEASQLFHKEGIKCVANQLEFNVVEANPKSSFPIISFSSLRGGRLGKIDLDINKIKDQEYKNSLIEISKIYSISFSELLLKYVLEDGRINNTIIGVSSIEQLKSNVNCCCIMLTNTEREIIKQLPYKI